MSGEFYVNPLHATLAVTLEYVYSTHCCRHVEWQKKQHSNRLLHCSPGNVTDYAMKEMMKEMISIQHGMEMS